MDFLEGDHEETENHLWTIATVFKLEKCTFSLIWFIAICWEIIKINIEVYDDYNVNGTPKTVPYTTCSAVLGHVVGGVRVIHWCGLRA